MDNKKIKDELKGCYVDVFSTNKGKRVLEDICLSAFGKCTTYDRCPTMMAMNEGARNLYLAIVEKATPVEENRENKTKSIT